tara:strand:+ start:230 stop:598 length:369 start_codon:yes stop_codon:yes gene_type:complete
MLCHQYLEFYAGYVSWTQQINDRVIFSDHSHKLLAVQNGTLSPLAGLADIDTWSHFFIRDSNLYILANDDNFWRFNLLDDTLTNLFYYPDTTVAFTDIARDQQHLLISRQVSAKKEIVLLAP